MKTEGLLKINPGEVEELEKPAAQIILESKNCHKEDNLTYYAQDQD